MIFNSFALGKNNHIQGQNGKNVGLFESCLMSCISCKDYDFSNTLLKIFS